MTGGPDFSEGAAWIEGSIVPIADAKISVLDWGLTHSDITYDVVSVWDGRFFRFGDYLDRFERSLLKLGLAVPQSRDEMHRICHDIVARSGLRQSYVSLVVSRGKPGIPGSRDPRDCINHFYAWCVPFVWVFKEDVIERGAHLYMPDGVHRIGQTSVDPTAKNYHWGDFTQGLMTAKETGFDNTLLTDGDGLVTEGPGFNIFVVRDGEVRTPKSGVLKGITRKVAMEICAAQGLSCSPCDLETVELLEADEVFATTTGGGIVPVVRINDRTFSNGAPGPVTGALQSTYWDWHDDPAMSEAIDYTSASANE